MKTHPIRKFFYSKQYRGGCLPTIFVGNRPACSSLVCSMTHRGGGIPTISLVCSMTHRGGGRPPPYGGVISRKHKPNSRLLANLVGNWTACSSLVCSMTHRGGGGPPPYGGVNLRTHQFSPRHHSCRELACLFPVILFNDILRRRRASALRGCSSMHTSIQFTPPCQSRRELACLFLVGLFKDISRRRQASALHRSHH